MSVGLLIVFHNNSEETDIYYPIATEENYALYWRSIARKLDLVWLQAFQEGIRIYPDDLPSVKRELLTLKEFLVSKPFVWYKPSTWRYSHKLTSFMLERLEDVIELLEMHGSSSRVQSISIG